MLLHDGISASTYSSSIQQESNSSKDVKVLSSGQRKLAFWLLIRTLNRIVAMLS